MKIQTLSLLCLLALAGCHAHRDDASTAASTGAKADKSSEKTRDSLMDRSMQVQDQHWASNPAGTSSAAAPAAASSSSSAIHAGATPATMDSPAATKH
ncbi:hypothetical protein [Fulvimonas soli]|uniref:Lipoprotein n=1 Tax=Fulvimonas soli TaxID=155197 RepID=A0A316IAF8_9GAMM|nr:hypothetical protein [Fulvimonas soli]PWK89806.1 hypothetical protein C7456_104158 [Fulvimonas soli]TNY27554.1 hypothetical protein BV497_02490 [Fulvimonas soli]